MARRRGGGGGGKSCSGKTCLIVFCSIVVVALVGFLIGFFVSYFKKSQGGDGSKYGDHCDPGNKYSCTRANMTCSNTSTCTCAPGYVVDDSSPSNVVCIKRTEKPGPVVSVTRLPGSPGQEWLYEVTFQPSPGQVASYSLVINGEQASGTNTTYTFRTLYPGQNCSYAITAFNGIQNPSEVSVGTFRLNTACPGEIRDLTAAEDNDNALVLTFLCPDPRDVPDNVKGYRIQKILLNSAGLPETNTSYVLSASRSSCTNAFNDGALGGVLVERNYTFSVRAWNDDFVGNYSQVLRFYVAPRVPKLYLDYDGFKLLQKVDNSGLGNTEFEVRVCSRCLLDSTRGTVLDVGLVVCAQGDGNNCSATVVTQLKNFNSWDDAKNNNFDVPYLTTPSNWLASLNATPSGLSYIIGHNTSCTSLPATSYCNGPLPTEQEITVIVVQCNVAGCGQIRYGDIFNNKGSSSGINVLALGIGMTWLVIILVVVVVVVCVKRQNASIPFNNLSEDERHNQKVSDPNPNQLRRETLKTVGQKNYETFSPEAPDPTTTQDCYRFATAPPASVSNYSLKDPRD